MSRRRSDVSNATVELKGISGLDLCLDRGELGLRFGPGLDHPSGERRMLDDVRPMLADPAAQGPDHLYTIYMDVCAHDDHPSLQRQGLLYGTVVYNFGAVGEERLRSQGHIHSSDPATGLRYSEIYDFWTGHGFVYLQKECDSVVSRALLIPVGPGDKVIVPLGWVHLTVSSADEVLSFGAWCARDNKLEYGPLRQLGGPAHFVLANGDAVPNARYEHVAEIEVVAPHDLPLLGVPTDRPIYSAWQDNPTLFDFLPHPELAQGVWDRL